MPIRRDLRKHYTKRSGWPAIRKRILDRAEHCCERCGAPDRLTVWRGPGGMWFDVTGSVPRWVKPGDILVDLRPPCERGIDVYNPPPPEAGRDVQVQLGIAHLNHTPGDNRDENLAAWCRECHLMHDAPQHKETRIDHKDARRPLLQIVRRSDQV